MYALLLRVLFSFIGLFIAVVGCLCVNVCIYLLFFGIGEMELPKNVGISTFVGILQESTIPKILIIGIVTYVRAEPVAITGLQGFDRNW